MKRHRGDLGGCRKVAFSKQSRADDRAAKMARQSGDDRLYSYKCQRCGKYHIGHNKFWKGL